jgi:SAM-dependent methyltransferase
MHPGHRDILAGHPYDQRLSSAYDEGQRVEPDTFHLWLTLFRRHAREGTPQSVLDLGCGTGLFDPALADAFGGPVYGVEPSKHMRAIAQRARPHRLVTYLNGGAERIPVADCSCDLVLMFLVLQHLTDRPAAAIEVSRVMKAKGRLLVAGRFHGESTPRAWSPYFPRADDMEELSVPTLEETRAMFEKVGLEFLAVERVRFKICDSLRDYLQRVRLRTVSAFEHLSDEEFAAGLARLEADAALETNPRPVFQDAHLVVFEKPASRWS